MGWVKILKLAVKSSCWSAPKSPDVLLLNRGKKYYHKWFSSRQSPSAHWWYEFFPRAIIAILSLLHSAQCTIRCAYASSFLLLVAKLSHPLAELLYLPLFDWVFAKTKQMLYFKVITAVSSVWLTVTRVTSVKSVLTVHVTKITSRASYDNIALRVNCGASVLQGEQYFTSNSASLPHLSCGASTHIDASMIQPRWLHWY